MFFEVSHRFEIGIIGVEVVQSTVKQVCNFWNSRFRLSNTINQFDKVGSGKGLPIVTPESKAGVFDLKVFEDMEIAVLGWMNLELTKIKQVELPANELLGRRAPLATVLTMPYS